MEFTKDELAVMVTALTVCRDHQTILAVKAHRVNRTQAATRFEYGAQECINLIEKISRN